MSILTYDQVALGRDPHIPNFNKLKHLARYDNADGRELFDLMTSRAGVSAMVGAVIAAPSKPVIAAVEDLLFSQMGERAFADPMKQLAGRIAKWVLVEVLGAVHTRRGVPITVTSRFSKGSTYQFDAFKRRPMKR